MPEFRVFVSAVSSEFGSARDALGASLRSRDMLIQVQSDFRQQADSDTTPRKLHDYIRDCSAVVYVIGKRSGACPSPSAAAPFAPMLPAGIKEASYTQWEFWFARHYGRRLSVYIASDEWQADKPAPESDRPDLQDALIHYIGEEQDLDRDYFGNVDRLCHLVLKEDWPRELPSKLILLPYPSLGTLFKGRDAFLRRLRASLTRPDGGAAAIAGRAVHGLGGVGKTRAAVEYAWAHRAEYTALALLDAETGEKLHAGLAALVGPLRLPEQAVPDEAARMEAALAWLNANPGWLLILDNIDSEPALDAANRLLGRLQGGHVVLTSRLSAGFARGVERLDLDVLSLDGAALFLLEATETGRRKAADDAAQARTLAEELGQLALALEMAAATIEARRLGFAAYRALWQGNSARVVGWASQKITGYHHAVAETWRTSVDQLTEAGRRLLERLAFLAPDPVPTFLLEVAVPGAEAEDAAAALDDLATYSLVTRDVDSGTFLVHRLVQDVTRRGLEAAGTMMLRLTEALGWVDAAYTSDPLDVGSWVRLDPLTSHAYIVAEHADAAGIETRVERLKSELILHLRRRALGQAKTREIATRMRPRPKLKEWTEQRVREGIELADALYEGGRVTREEYLLFSVYPVEAVHDNRWMGGGYDSDLKPISDRMREIEREHGLLDGEYWSKGDGPEEYRRLSDAYDAVLDTKFETTLREFGLQTQADLWRGNRLEYDRQREIGRLRVFGPIDVKGARAGGI